MKGYRWKLCLALAMGSFKFILELVRKQKIKLSSNKIDQNWDCSTFDNFMVILVIGIMVLGEPVGRELALFK